MQSLEPWHGRCRLQFQTNNGSTKHQGGCTAPVTLLRADRGGVGRGERADLGARGGLERGEELSSELERGPGRRGGSRPL